MDIEDAVRRAILFTADEAWEIACNGDAPPATCRLIEALSDDPETCDQLVAAIMKDIAAIDAQHET